MFRVIKRVSIYLFSMPVSLAQWRGEIGAFYNNTLTFSKISIFYLLLWFSRGSIFCRLDVIKLSLLIISLILNGIIFFHFKKCRKINRKIGVYLFTTIYLLIISNLLEYLWVGSRIISLSGDIEINPGPKLNALNRCFSICHWNLNSISAHMFTKVSLLSAYSSVHKFDIICFFETYLNSETPSDDENLEITGIILSEKITHLTANVVKSMFTIKAPSHLMRSLITGAKLMSLPLKALKLIL